MNLEEILGAIESPQTTVRVNVASSWRTFYRAVFSLGEVEQLESLLVLPATVDAVLSRIQELSKREVDPRYENIWDVPLAVYVLLLARHDPVIARLGIEAAQPARQCWWLYQVVHRLSNPQATQLSSESVGVQMFVSYATPFHRLVVAAPLSYDALITPSVMYTYISGVLHGRIDSHVHAGGSFIEYRIEPTLVRTSATSVRDDTETIAA